MNRFAYQMAHNGHLSFNQKCRSLLMQTFGHEALFNVDELRGNSHCYVFNIDIYRIAAIKKEYLAKRKLFNPFKWLEFAIVFPLELISWSLQRVLAKLWRKVEVDIRKASTLRLLVMFLVNDVGSHFLAPIVNMLAHLALAIPKRIVAPVRYIIRPTIEFARTQPQIFAITLIGALFLSAIIAASIFTGGIPIIIGGATLAGLIVAKTAVAASIAVGVWATLLKVVTGTQDLITAIARAVKAPWKQPIEKFEIHSSTEKITQTFHAINPDLTRVNKPEEQNCAQTLALMTGTEAIFYTPKKTPSTQVESVPHSKRCC